MKNLLLALSVITLISGCGNKSESKSAVASPDQKLYSYFIKCYPVMDLEAEAHKNAGMEDAKTLSDSSTAFRIAAFTSGEKLGFSQAKVDADLLSALNKMRKPIADADSKSAAEQAEIAANFKKVSSECSASLEGDPEILAAFKTAAGLAK